MAYQSLALGSSANDGTGDTLRAGGDKINDNFVEIYTLLGTGSALTSGLSASASVVTLTSPVLTTATVATSLDMNGTELILDADADTSIHASTDDQIDIKIAGADDFAFKANTFEVQTGSNIDMNGTELILDADGDTSITADTDDQIDFKLGGSDRMSIGSDGHVTISNGNLIMYSGKGIDFSGTGDSSGRTAELLDDYEEGTWTPTLTSGGSVTINAAVYTKIGNLVRVGAYLALSSIPNNNSAFYIAGLPYNVSYTAGGGNDHYHGAGSITYVGAHNIASFGMLPPTPYTGQANFYFHRGDGSSSTVLNSNMTGCPYIIVATSYMAA